MDEDLHAMERELIKRWRSDAAFLREKDPRTEIAGHIAATYEGNANSLEMLINATERKYQ